MSLSSTLGGTKEAEAEVDFGGVWGDGFESEKYKNCKETNLDVKEAAG